MVMILPLDGRLSGMRPMSEVLREVVRVAEDEGCLIRIPLFW